MELWVQRVTKACEGWASAGHRGWARPSQVPCTGCFISMTLVKRILCGAMGMWGLLVGLTKEGWVLPNGIRLWEAGGASIVLSSSD